MKKKILGLLLLLISIFTISNVFADTEENKTFNGFKAAAGEKIAIDEDVNGSAAIAGETIDINKTIDGIAFLASNVININGEIEYAFLAGNTININGKITKDAFIASNYVTTSKESNIARDIFIAASDIDLGGSFDRNIVVIGEIVNINDATIKGDITIYANDIVIGNNVTIEGTLKYNENVTPTIGENASINKTETMNIEKTSDENTIMTNIQSIIYSIVGLLVVFIVIQVVSPNLFKNVAKLTTNKQNNIVNITLIGIASLFVIPIISIMLMISTFGLSLSILLLTLYFVIMYLSTIFTGYAVGNYIYDKLIKKDDNPYAKGAIGIILISLLKLIPYIGTIVNLISISLGFGITLKLIKNQKNKEEN